MSKAIYLGGADNLAHKVKKIYIGDQNNISHKVKKVYVGDANNQSKLVYSAGISSFVSSTGTYRGSVGTEWIDKGKIFIAFGGGSYNTYAYTFDPETGNYSQLANQDLGQMSCYPRYAMWIDDTRILGMSIYENSSYPDKNGIQFFIFDTTTNKFERYRGNSSLSGTNVKSFCIVDNIVHTRVGKWDISWNLNTYEWITTDLGYGTQADVLVNTPDRTKGYFVGFTTISSGVKGLKIWGVYGNTPMGLIKTIPLDMSYNWNVVNMDLLIEAREYGEYWWYIPGARMVLALDVNNLTVRYLPCTNEFITINGDMPCAYNRELKSMYMFTGNSNTKYLKLQAIE